MHHVQLRLTNRTFWPSTPKPLASIPLCTGWSKSGRCAFASTAASWPPSRSSSICKYPFRQNVQQVHGITDAMVRGKPTIEQVLPHFIEFLGESDTILLAHNAPFDFGFLAMALIRLGIPYPLHRLLDTHYIACRFFPNVVLSHSLESMAALALTFSSTVDNILRCRMPRSVKDALPAMLRYTPTVETIAEGGHIFAAAHLR